MTGGGLRSYTRAIDREYHAHRDRERRRELRRLSARHVVYKWTRRLRGFKNENMSAPQTQTDDELADLADCGAAAAEEINARAVARGELPWMRAFPMRSIPDDALAQLAALTGDYFDVVAEEAAAEIEDRRAAARPRLYVVR